MNQFNKIFADPNNKVFLPYFTLGYPTVEQSFELIKTAIDSGAEGLELGVPFSDPVADGPSNQKAMAVALKNGMNFDKALTLIAKIKAYKPDVAIGLLLYYNLIFHRGIEKTYKELKAAGVDAIVAPELPLEESAQHEKLLSDNDLGCVHMVFPNTPPARAKQLLQRSTAFTYVVARMGPTGASVALDKQVAARIKQLKQISDKPIVMGFGLSKPEHVKTVLTAGANGAIVASKFVEWINADIETAKQKISQFIKESKG